MRCDDWGSIMTGVLFVKDEEEDEGAVEAPRG